MIPSWLARWLPHIGIMVVFIGAVWWLDHRGYERALADRDARDARLLDGIRTDLRQSEQRLTLSISRLADDYEHKREAIAQAGASLKPVILQEVARDPRLSDPAAGLTPGLLDVVNRARSAGACTATASGRVDCALSVPAAGAGQSDR